MRLSETIYGSGRNSTCDNWYTTVPLVKELMKRKLTLVGTLRKYKKQLSKTNIQQQAPGTSIFDIQYKGPSF